MIEDFHDYLAAVEERQHLQGVIERGRKQFSGYGLELFERGLRGKIAKLTDAIAQWDAQSGYNLTTSDWCGRNNLQVFTCKVAGQYISDHVPDASAIAVLSNVVVLNCNNVRMLQGPMSFYRSVQLNSLCGLESRDSMDILGSPSVFLGRSSQDRFDTQCGSTLPKTILVITRDRNVSEELDHD